MQNRELPLIKTLDHLVLTVKDIDKTINFYQRVLGMHSISFGDNNQRKALIFGSMKINLHQVGKEFEPKAQAPTSGSADLCFITNIPIIEFMQHLQSLNVSIIEGPINRTGALGPIISVYFRDPDENLIEIANYL